MASSKIISVDLSEEELARIREVLFRELREVARILVEQADGGAQNEPSAGADASGTYRLSLAPVAELLDRIGWGTERDLALALRDDARRRVDELDRFDHPNPERGE